MTDGAQSPGLNELSGHLRGVAHRLWACMSAYMAKDRKGVVIMWDALESVGSGHDEVGIQLRVDIVLVFTGVELLFFLVAVFWI